MSAAGKVCTGFSLPYVATYAESSGTVTYSNGQKLARGVSVAVSVGSSDNNVFYADNVSAESTGGLFADGELTLTVDGLLQAAEALISGLPTQKSLSVGSGTVKYYGFGDDQAPPYVGVGFVARYMQDGVASWVPIVLTKCRFKQAALAASTQEEDIDWQTQELTADILRDDTSNHEWKWLFEDQASEAAAEAVLQAALGIAA